MRKILCSVKSFITFDFALDSQYIGERFLATHGHYKANSSHWCFAATRRKVISNYWLRHVIAHFGALYGLATLFTLSINPNFHYSFLIPVILVGFLSFSVLFITYYWLFFYSDFLPKLDTVIAMHEHESKKEEKLEKCRRSQFSIPTLTVIFFAFTKSCKINFPPCNDQSAELLNNLFGSDRDKIKENLRRLYKLSTLSPKERAEIVKGINVARWFFNSLQHPAAIEILDQLELKLQRG